MNYQDRKQAGYFNRPFGNTLPALLGKETPRQSNDYENLPKVNNGEVDGRDHINVHHHAKTDLGLALAPHAEFSVIHPQYGQFLTVQGLLAWLTNPNQPDIYRTMSGREVDASMRAYGITDRLRDYAYQYLFATWYKIKSHAKVERWMHDSSLRFEHYYLHNTLDPVTQQKTGNIIRIRNKSAGWVINGMEELRKALHENREPELEIFLPPHLRAKLQKSRAKEAEKEVVPAPKQRETDVILQADLRSESEENKVVRVLTPEQLERKRLKTLAFKARRKERKKERRAAAALEAQNATTDGRCVEITEPSAPVLCTLGIRDIDVLNQENAEGYALYLEEHQQSDMTESDYKNGLDAAVRKIDDLVAENKQITIQDIELQYVTNAGGTAFLGMYRLNGVTLLEREADAGTVVEPADASNDTPPEA